MGVYIICFLSIEEKLGISILRYLSTCVYTLIHTHIHTHIKLSSGHGKPPNMFKLSEGSTEGNLDISNLKGQQT